MAQPYIIKAVDALVAYAIEHNFTHEQVHNANYDLIEALDAAEGSEAEGKLIFFHDVICGHVCNRLYPPSIATIEERLLGVVLYEYPNATIEQDPSIGIITIDLEPEVI